MSTSAISLSGKTAVITGGRRGIGKAIALAFADAGADIVVCDSVVEDGQLEGVAKDIQRLGRKSLAIKMEVTNKPQIESMVQKVLDRFGAIDILVNNAGIMSHGPLLDTSEEEWDRVLDVDLKGYFLCSQVVCKQMVRNKKGVIICTASQFGFKAVPGVGVYCIAKAGVVMLTRVLARELGAYGIRVNAIAPGLVKTELSRRGWDIPENLEKRLPGIPLGRIAETSDLVGAALFLASDSSNYVSGHIIIIDGGEMA